MQAGWMRYTRDRSSHPALRLLARTASRALHAPAQLLAAFAMLGVINMLMDTMLLPTAFMATYGSPFRRDGGSSRGLVMCAYDTRSLQLAWTQITALRTLHGLDHERFTIYHADELNEEQHGVHLAALRAVPGVSVESLVPWLNKAYSKGRSSSVNETFFASKEAQQMFRGFYCKPAALLASRFDVVALVDLDAVVMSNPFELMQTTIFRHTGMYAFRDRRVFGLNKQMSEYGVRHKREVLAQLWHAFNPDQPDLPLTITRNPIFTGWSYHHGESAIVVYDKRWAGGAPAAVLSRLLGDLKTLGTLSRMLYGDKELYTLSYMLADVHFEMNPYMPTDVGRAFFKDSKGNEVDKVCSARELFAQWVPGNYSSSTLYAQPKIMYINGNGVEQSLTANTWDITSMSVGNPFSYEAAIQLHRSRAKTCTSGGLPLPRAAREMVSHFKAIYKSFPSNSSSSITPRKTSPASVVLRTAPTLPHQLKGPEVSEARFDKADMPLYGLVSYPARSGELQKEPVSDTLNSRMGRPAPLNSVPRFQDEDGGEEQMGLYYRQAQQMSYSSNVLKRRKCSTIALADKTLACSEARNRTMIKEGGTALVVREVEPIAWTNIFHFFWFELVPAFYLAMRLDGENYAPLTVIVPKFSSEIQSWSLDLMRSFARVWTLDDLESQKRMFEQNSETKSDGYVLFDQVWDRRGHNNMGFEPSEFPTPMVQNLALTQMAGILTEKLSLRHRYKDRGYILLIEQEADNSIVERQLRDYGSRSKRAIVDVLRTIGVEVRIMKTKGMSLLEQAQAVAGAAVLVGPHGTGLTNLVFLDTHAVVVEVTVNVNWCCSNIPMVCRGKGRPDDDSWSRACLMHKCSECNPEYGGKYHKAEFYQMTKMFGRRYIMVHPDHSTLPMGPSPISTSHIYVNGTRLAAVVREAYLMATASTPLGNVKPGYSIAEADLTLHDLNDALWMREKLR